MKVKVKLDAGSLKELILEHIEKIGLGIVALIALFIVYSAFGNANSIDKTPAQLNQAADQADRAIEATTVAEAEGLNELNITDYAARAVSFRTPVQEAEYKTPIVWSPPLYQPKQRRIEPPLLAAAQLRAKADYGPVMKMVAVEPDAAAVGPGNPAPIGMAATTNEVRGDRWVVVTALVPISKQEEAYFECYRNCVLPTQNDVPVYLGYWVQRVELNSPTAPADIDWSKAETIQSNKAMTEAMSKWAQSSSEVVEQKFLHERLVFPLPPLVGKQWEKEVAHEPEIPLPSLEAGMGTMPGMGRGMGMEGGRFGQPGGMRGRPGMPGMPGGEGFGRPGTQPGFEDPFNPTDPNDPRSDPSNPDLLDEQNKPPANLLLRFIDFNVEPGKHYAYRVQLALQNPNYGIKPLYLEKPDLATSVLLKTKWSDSSPVVSVPRDTRVLAVSVSPSRSGRVLISKWLQPRGFTAHEEFNVERGQVLDFADKLFRRVEGGQALPAGMEGMGGMEGMPPPGMMPPGLEGMPPGRTQPARPGARRTPRDTRRGPAGMEDFPNPEMMPGGPADPRPLTPAQPGTEWMVNYYTNAIAIDFRGGENLTPPRGAELTAVGEILLFDMDGNLIVCNELDDQPDREKITAAAAPAGNLPGGIPGSPAPGVNPRGALDGLFQQQYPPPSNRRPR